MTRAPGVCAPQSACAQRDSHRQPYLDNASGVREFDVAPRSPLSLSLMINSLSQSHSLYLTTTQSPFSGPHFITAFFIFDFSFVFCMHV